MQTILNDALKQIERYIVTVALNCANGDISKAARELGLERTTLSERLKRYGVKTKTEGFRPATIKPAKDRVNHSEFTAIKERIMLEALEACAWNRTAAAENIGCSLRSLRMWVAQMKARGVDIPDNKIKKKAKRIKMEMSL